jgi:predicted MFS family arabinose efflux permease
MRDRSGLAVFLLAAGTAGWNAGNVGPVVGSLADEFSVSLASVGLLSGTYFFAGVVAADIAGAALARRIPIAGALRACCLLCFAGNVLFAISPGFAGLVVARLLIGVGVGIALLFGAAFARQAGGVRTLGLFGAGITLGVAAPLALGSVLEDAGVDWRVGFWISALMALTALPLLPAEVPRPSTQEPRRGLLREALTTPVMWRLELLAISVLTVPLVIGAWLVGYLSAGDSMSTAAAGVFGFALFGLSAVARDLGGRLSAAGVSRRLLAVGGLLVATAGLVVLAESRTVEAAALVVVLTGVGFSLPYPLFYDEGERAVPDRPLAGLGLLQIGANAFPIVAIPLIGKALSDGRHELAFLSLAGLVAATAIVSLWPGAGEPAGRDASPTSAAPG